MIFFFFWHPPNDYFLKTIRAINYSLPALYLFKIRRCFYFPGSMRTNKKLSHRSKNKKKLKTLFLSLYVEFYFYFLPLKSALIILSSVFFKNWCLFNTFSYFKVPLSLLSRTKKKQKPTICSLLCRCEIKKRV